MPYSLFRWKAHDGRNANIDLSFIFFPWKTNAALFATER